MKKTMSSNRRRISRFRHSVAGCAPFTFLWGETHVASAVFVPWLVAALSCPGQAGGQAPAQQPEPQGKVTMVIILASERCQFIDPRLKNVATELQKEYPKLTGFNLVSMTDMSLAGNAKGAFDCVEGEKAEVHMN